MTLARGTTIERYTILSLVGQGGGVGEVYAAYDPKLDRKVALKLLRADDADDSGPAHLLREAKAMARVSHPNVVRVHDAGTFGRHIFLAMDFVEGSTLSDWLAERPRGKDEVIGVFVQAAHGLMAAYDAGLVHRDFKPGNVIVDPSGTARVADFGAAATEARTDQFSFCRALYQALPATAKSTVPEWQRRVLLRGASISPDDRWPSMRELVVALTHDGARVRRRWALALGLSLLVAVPAIFLARRSGPAASLCRGGAARIADAWEIPRAEGGAHPRRDAVQGAFLASGVPGAKEVWDRVAAQLDRYATGWLAMYDEACVATQVLGTQSASVLDLRMSCLNDRRTALLALTEVFGRADRGTVAKGVNAVNALPDLERCADLEALRTPVEPPRDEATRLRVADFRRRQASAKALNDTGQHVEARVIYRRVISEARELGYRPALAAALGELADTYQGLADATEVVSVGDEALWTALSAGSDDLAANAASARAAMSYHFATDVAECRHWLKLATALSERAGPKQDRHLSWLLQTGSMVEHRANNFSKALELTRQAAALKEKVLPKGHPDIAMSWNGQAEVLHSLGRNEEALVLNTRASEVFVAAYGPASVEAAFILSNRGEYLLDLGRASDALAIFRESLSRWEPHTGPDHQNLAYPLTGIGRALVALGRPKEAIPPLERAHRVRDPAHNDPKVVAETAFALAQALVEAGLDPSRARSLATNARDAYRRAANVKQADAVEAWLEADQRR